MYIRKLSPAVLLAFAFALPLSAAADNHESPPPLTDVWIMVPKQGMEMKFEAALKTHAQYRVDQGESAEWTIYTPVVGDKMNIYQIRSCCHDYAGIDTINAEAMEKGLSAHWNENVHQYVDHYHHYLERNDWEHSHMPEDAGPFRYYWVTSWKWKVGSGPGPDDARKRFSIIAKEQGWADEDHQWLWLSRIGGEPTLMLVTPAENWADMEPSDPSFYDFLVEKLGSSEAADALFTEFESGFTSSSDTVWMERGDLSASAED